MGDMLMLPERSLSTLDTVHCMDALSLLRAMGDHSIDAIITDLPYGTTACSWDVVIPFAPMWKEVKRVLKPRGVFVTTASQPFTSTLICSNLEMFKYCFAWNKGNATGHLDSKKRPLRLVEDVVVFYSQQPTYNPQMSKRDKPEMLNSHGRRKNIGGGGDHVYGKHRHIEAHLSTHRYPTNLLAFSFGNKANLKHPTQKPVALYEYLICTYTNEGDVVLDMCCGSGTTAIAARNTKRHFIVGDSSAKYVAIARDRLRLPFERRHVKQETRFDDLPMFAAVTT